MRILRRRLRQPVAPPPVAVPASTGTPVRFLGSTQLEAAAVEMTAGGRYRCQPEEGETPRLIVAEPGQVTALDRIRVDHPGAGIIVWDRGGATTPVDVARAFDAGVDAYVNGGTVELLVAYLDALQRTRLARSDLAW